MKNGFKKKIIFNIISIFFIVISISFGIFFSLNNSKLKHNDFIVNTGYYNSNQYAIQSASAPDDENVISLNQLYTLSVNNNIVTVAPVANYSTLVGTKTITISTSNDLFALSNLSNNTNCQENFLSFNYKLLDNIDYTDCPYKFVPIGWNYEGGFTGIFDGNGYEIINLSFIPLANEEGPSPYASMEYFAMFSHVGSSGIVSNFGLVNPSIRNTISTANINLIGIAPLVGLNEGEVSYVFVRDLKDVEEAGIYATGGYQIAGLAVRNQGNLHDSYVAYTRIVNFEVVDCLDFNEIMLLNAGTISNLFYYNSSIVSYSLNGNLENVTYNASVGKVYSGRMHLATYTSSLESGVDSLSSLLEATNNDMSAGTWYTKNSYAGIANQLSIITPITRGIEYNDDTKTFTVNNEYSLCYMFELMNENSTFASSIYTYLITSDMDLSLLSADNYFYDQNIAATITGHSSESYQSVSLANGQYSTYPTFYNMSFENYALSEGVECYGLFPYLSGTVSNLNIVVSDYDFDLEATENMKSIGFVSGYVDGGTINNVNVKYDTLSSSNNIGKYYFGSVAGVLTNNSEVSNVTANGTFNDSSVSSNISFVGYDAGNSVGGIVGYITNSMSNVNNALSCVNFNVSATGNFDYSIAGIIGSGYTKNTLSGTRTSNLENRGNIVINSSANLNNLYVSGVLGRHYGMANQITMFNNAGNITLNDIGNSSTYLSGITNVDLNNESQLKSYGKRKYYASSFTNGADIVLNVRGNNSVYYSNVCNIKNNNYASEVSGFYNLGYNSSTLATLSDMNINMSNITSYAPVINHINGSSGFELSATTIYNLRDINYTYNSNITTSTVFNYSGCAIGNFSNYEDIRNEGDLTFSFTNGTNSTKSSLYISGLFDELSSGCSAKKLYNAGNITVTDASTTAKYFNIYIGGICSDNQSEISDQTYNPLDSSFDDDSIGSLDSAINNGDIIVETSFSTNIPFDAITPSYNFYANVYVGGISYNNKGIITNAFNLGDIELKMYSREAALYEVAGISCVNNGSYAQIRDCANNGDLEAIDMDDEFASKVFVGGIVAHNNDQNTNISQIIAFTINYGSLLSFNGLQNMQNSNITISGSHARSGGILSTGLCNIVNVVNYGNVYSSEAAAGMTTVVNLADYSSSITASIANTINYGNIMIVPRYYGDGISNNNFQKYDDIHNLTNPHAELSNISIHTYSGSLVTFFNFNEQTNVNVRYLINFYEYSAVVLYNLNPPAEDIDVSTFITTRGVNDYFGAVGNKLKYAPMSTSSFSNGNHGVFSENFIFRKAIDGVGLNPAYVTDSYIADFFQFVRFDKVNDNLLDTIGWTTIAYADAAESFAKSLSALSVFVTKTNSEDLLEEAFTNSTWITNSDVTLLSSFINESVDSGKLDQYLSSILEYALFDESSKASFTTNVRNNLIDQVMNYYVEYYDELGETNYLELLNSILYDELLAKVVAGDSAEYSLVLSKIREVLETSDNKEIIISNYLNLLQNEIDNSVSNNNSVLFPLFDSETGPIYEQTKLNILTTLLDGYDDVTLEEIYNTLDESSSSDALKYTMYLRDNQSDTLEMYSNLIAYNDFSNSAYLTLINSYLSKYDVANVLDNETLSTIEDNNPIWSGQSLTPTLLDANNNEIVPTRNYANLWNIIKNDSNIQDLVEENFSNYVDPTNGNPYFSLLAKATEWNNTYQTNDKPQSYFGIPEDDRFGINYGTSTNTYYAADVPIKRYLYTPDDVVTYATNYIGPFRKNGTPFDCGGNLTSNNRNYNLGFVLTAVDTSSDISRAMVPIFISSNLPQLQNIVAESGSPFPINTTTGDNYRVYYACDSATKGSNNGAGDFHWKSDLFVTGQPGNAKGFLYNNYNTGTYLFDHYNFDPELVYTKNYDYNTNNTLPNGVNTCLMNETGESHTYDDYYFKGYCSSSMITGVWYNYSMWNPGSGTAKYTSLVAKLEGAGAFGQLDSGGYYGVHTTDYIYYQMQDLINLDGIRTKGMCNNIEDRDEINIISALVTKILSTPTGPSTVLKAIANYAKNNDFGSNKQTAVNMLLSSLKGTTFARDMIINNVESILPLYYFLMDTFNTYLSSLNIQLDSLLNQILAKTSTDLPNFRKLLLLLSEYSANNSSYTFTRTNITKFIYDYVTYLYSENASYTDQEIQNAIDAITSNAILNDINELFSTNIQMDLSNYVHNGFTLNNFILYNQSDSTYAREILAQNNATVSLTTGNNVTGYSLEVTFDGTFNGVASSGIDTISINLNSNLTYNYNVSSGTKIYDIKLIRNETTTQESGTAVSAPITTLTSNSGFTTTGSTYTMNTSTSQKKAYISFDRTQITGATILSSSLNMNITNPNDTDAQTEIRLGTGTGNSFSWNDRVYQSSFHANKAIQLSLVDVENLMSGNDFSLQFILTDKTAGRTLTINSIVLKTVFVLEDYTIVTLYENLFVPSSSYYTLVNHDNDCTVRVNNNGNVNNRNVTSTLSTYNGAFTYSLTFTPTVSETLSSGIDNKVDLPNILMDNTTTKAVEFDYTALSSFDIDTIIPDAIPGKTKYQTFIERYHQHRLTDENTSYSNDIMEQLMVLFPTMKRTENGKTYYTVFDEAVFTDPLLIEIITLIAKSDYDSVDSALNLLIAELPDNYLGEIIKSLTESSVQENIAKKIINTINNNPLVNFGNIPNYAYAFYLGNDYLNKSANDLLLSSKMYTILNGYESGAFQFILTNSTVNSLKFIELVNHLTSSGDAIDISGYGIFALSSSKGIKDGIFIPDNFTLSEMDVFYKITDGKWMLYNDGVASAEWRGGIASNLDKKDISGSVNEAFLVSMKQLKKSISTAVFSLNLSNNDYNLYSSESLINLDAKTITYYVPQGYFNGGTKTFTVSKISFANSASSSLDVNDSMTLSLGENPDKLTITAEDDTVIADYTIIVLEMEISFDISSTTDEIAYNSGEIVINLTSPSSSNPTGNALPNRLDLSPFMYLLDSNLNVVDSYNPNGLTPFTYINLSTDDDDHLIYNGLSTITFGVDSSLPTGTYRLYMNIFNQYGLTNSGKYITFTKLPSTESSLTDVSFDGNQVQFTLNSGNYVANSTIKYGRAYSYDELYDLSYLDYLPTISSGATVSKTVTKSVNATTNSCMKYTVRYVITAENGTSTTYIHNLVENTPFVEGGVGTNYVNWYIDGSSQESLVYQVGEDNEINASFERGEEPVYRVKYVMSYFYTIGNAVYSYEAPEIDGIATTILYSGLSVVITDIVDAGEYSFKYIYQTTGDWQGSSYTRVYEFPSINISKNESKDATLSRITFLDSYEIASGLSTIIRPNYSLRPSDNNLDENEIYYYDMFNSSYARDVVISGKTIKYDNLLDNDNNKKDYATTDSTNQYFTNDFFVLGSIANAELSYYAPTFAIEDHAEIYQYTTLTKLTEYGLGQERTDADLLTDRSETMYLYVPFVDSSNNTRVFMVELYYGEWTNVYTTAYNGSNETPIANMNGNRLTTITYNGIQYNVSNTAGNEVSNVSLYMDYIGAPAEDHFWFVSYIVFSEDYLSDSSLGTTSFNNDYYKCYHISLIDITNTVYFDISIKAPLNFALESLYLTLSFNTYNMINLVETKQSTQISGYANKDLTTQFVGFDSYSLNSNYSVLPNGYYYFALDLPDGYSARYTVTNNKTNRNIIGNDAYKAEEEGAYLPPASIVTQRVNILIEIYTDESVDLSSWGVATSSLYTRDITFNGVTNED